MITSGEAVHPLRKLRAKAMLPTFYVWAKWDPEGGVWYTAESTIAGLNSSGETLEELRERLLLLIPDFLENEMPERARLHIIAEREDELTPIAAEEAVEISA